ncbi:MAG: hypothetical protein NVSMB57_07290 [Actinomycetota bacterium]
MALQNRPCWQMRSERRCSDTNGSGNQDRSGCGGDPFPKGKTGLSNHRLRRKVDDRGRDLGNGFPAGGWQTVR